MARKLEGYLSGPFPRSEALVEATRSLDRKRISPRECEEVRSADVAAVVALQRDAGLTYLTDGQLNWQDLFRPVVEACTGMKAEALMRWFDNNTFYRKPAVAGPVTLNDGLPHEYFQVRQLEGEPWKAVLPGPFTMARASEERGGEKGRRERVAAFAAVLKRASRWCADRGAKQVQFCEPWLVYEKPGRADLEAASDAYDTVAKGLRAESVLFTYFGDLKRVYPAVLDFSVDAVGVDLTATNITDLASHDFDKGAVLGALDGRNSLVESPAELVGLAKQAQDALDPDWVALTTTCGLDLCPRPVAERKVEALGRALAQGRDAL
jgi:5-methyltetrahydropteroyltriglutamate--homocysteine methyltransferase